MALTQWMTAKGKALKYWLRGSLLGVPSSDPRSQHFSAFPWVVIHCVSAIVTVPPHPLLCFPAP